MEIPYEIIKNQPITNIGMLGSVSDGKSTTVFQLTGTKTQKHSSELQRNITIKPGYANMKIYKDDNDELISSNSSKKMDGELLHHISFVDCPGHYELIMTMLSNIDLMDGVIVVVSAAEPLTKKPQLLQHLIAIKMANFEKVIICINKLDLVSKETAIKRKNELDELLKKLDIKPKMIIPISMNKGLGKKFLLESIIKYFPPKVSDKDKTKHLQFRLSRSFDINKKNTNFDDVQGGVLGGSLISGELKVGDDLEIKPGLIKKNSKGEFECITLKTKVLSLQTDNEKLDKIVPGGLIGIGTDIDPFYCKNDNLSGNIVGLAGQLPNVYSKINLKLEYNFINFDETNEWIPNVNEVINLQVSTNNLSGIIVNVSDNVLEIDLNKPVCIDDSMMIILSKKINDVLNIIGYGYL